MNSVLFDLYQKEIKGKIQKDFGIKNPMNVPSIEKVCVNVGMGSYLTRLGSKDFSFVEDNITRITGQKPVIKHARLSVSNFKLREGQPVGASVTLRKSAAYNFLYKLVNVAFPRVRDFRGIDAKLDKDGNLTIGLNDHTVFPEAIVPENSQKVHGLEITIVTSTKNKEHSKALLDAFQIPFKKKNQTT